MIRTSAYRLPALIGLFLMMSCHGRKEETNWNVTLDKEWKQPYGTYLAYKTLPQYFPSARVEDLARGFRYTSIDEGMSQHGDSAGLLVMVGLKYFISDGELNRILSFARAGNEVLIFSSELDNKLEQALHCRKQNTGNEEYPIMDTLQGTKNRVALRLLPDTGTAYGYEGRTLESFFKLSGKRTNASGGDDTTAVDSTSMEDYAASTGEDENGNTVNYAKELPYVTAEVLGTAPAGPDFVRFKVGGGHITLHAAPLVLSNYFLLQKGNRRYLDGIWHSFPANISHVYWNEYFKRTTQGSHFGILWQYPSTRYALILAIIALLTYVLFGLKRRQRIVPILPPVENASVSFVETVGRLYFNKGNHANLAEKMIQHFLEWVRTYYFLDTNQLNPVFTRQLAAKSGQPEAKVRELMDRIHEVRLGSVEISGAYLYELHRLIQSFYHNHRS